MSKTSKAWMQEHVNDTYVKQAQADGFRSRAAYKLKEIDERDHLLTPGQVVVDLGAAPGSWTQVIASRVGASGKVIGVDLLPVDPIAGVELIQGDFREDAILTEVEKALAGRKVDLVVSDMAPNISGISSADQARSLHLCELALEFSCKHLKKGGNFLVKTFQGAGFNAFQKDLHKHFKTVTSRKPQASRGRSSEMYLLAKGLIDPAE
jgi:23S rRNA (uridine2552-2'-O)-methyltransferase